MIALLEQGGPPYGDQQLSLTQGITDTAAVLPGHHHGSDEAQDEQRLGPAWIEATYTHILLN